MRAVAKFFSVLSIIFVLSSSYFIITAQAGSLEQHPAINNPDKFAWDLFLELIRPADPSKRGIPDPKKKIGDPGTLVWESWKLARSEVFLEDGSRPTTWDHIDMQLLQDFNVRFEPPKAQLVLQHEQPGEAGLFFDPSLPLANETRMNRDQFEFIINNNLYNVDGQEAFFDSGKRMDFPVGSKEVKAAWKELSKDEIGAGATKRYYTAKVMTDQGEKIYGLVGLHVITKDIPNWFWSTFEHKDNPPSETLGVRYFDRHTNGGQSLPDMIKDTLWQNYRLVGTQVDFLDSMGRPTILANTQIEQGFQKTSSCIACHAHATIGPKMGDRANRLPIFPRRTSRCLDKNLEQNCPPEQTQTFLDGWVGAVDPDSFVDAATGRRKYTQTDFVWSLFRAHRKQTP